MRQLRRLDGCPCKVRLPECLTLVAPLAMRRYTIHLRKLLHGVGFKKRAPRAGAAVVSGAFPTSA